MCTISLQINNVNKKYGKKNIIIDINITLINTFVNIVIGENGSGKSTLIKCINNLINYEGTIVNNENISYFPEKINLPKNLKVIDFLNLIIKCKKEVRKIPLDYFIEKFKLSSHMNKKIKEISLGTKQKILLIQTLIEDASIYIFDEPLNGLDDEMSKILIEELIKLHQQNKMLIIVSHDYKRLTFDSVRIIEIKEGRVNG